MVQMPDGFFSLRTYCALRARCAVGCFGCSFFAARQRTNQENEAGDKPPAPPRRRGRRNASRFGAPLRSARRGLKILASANSPSCSAPPPRRVGRGSMPDFGRTHRRHIKKGGVWLKTVLYNRRGTSMRLRRREIFGFPDALSR